MERSGNEENRRLEMRKNDEHNNSEGDSSAAGGRTSLSERCGHVAKKQRAKFYILRRCIAMLVCWHERID